jgi:MOSC domain-containing protein YiiM
VSNPRSERAPTAKTPSSPVQAPRVVGVQIGRPREYRFGTRTVTSAIDKLPQRGAVRIGHEGIEGDTQVDRRYHGGVERALCAYVAEHLAEWSRELGRLLAPGSFGENLTIEGWDERTVHIGDRFRFGSALLEVTQPREPCSNLAGKLEAPSIIRRIQENGWTGWYSRVLEPGEAAEGLPFVREREDPARITLAEAYRLRLDKGARRDELQRLLDVAGLSSGWRLSLTKRL